MSEPRLDPPEPSLDEVWIESRVEELFDEMTTHLDKYTRLTLFDYLDTNGIEQRLRKIATEELEELKAEAFIAAWEDRQRWAD